MRRDNKKVKQEGPSQVKVHLRLRPLSGHGLVVSELVVKRELVTLPELKSKRRKYSKEAKWAIVEAAKKLGSVEALEKRAHNSYSIYSSVHPMAAQHCVQYVYKYRTEY